MNNTDGGIECFETEIGMTFRWGPYTKVKIRYWPVYGTMQIKKECSSYKDWIWANRWDRDEILNHAKFQSVYNEYKKGKCNG